MATYQIVGTKEPYTGRVIKIGDQFYTTVGGGIEGDRQQVEPIEALGDFDTLPPVITDNNLNVGQTTPSDTNRDVVTTFVVGDNSNFGRNTYYYSNGSIVPNGTPLHHHTIPAPGDNNFMTQHNMDDNVQSVFLTPQSNTRRTNQRTRTNNQQATNTRTQANRTGGAQPGGGMSGGGSGGGGGGGY